MGLFSWIKNKYYDYRLGWADKFVENREFDKAQLIYESLLGKQPIADVHLAKMLTNNATGVNNKIEVLKRLLELQQFSTEVSIADFTAVLNSHVSSIEKMAAQSFNSNRYNDAVTLLTSIKDFRKDSSYSDNLYRYKAYLSFDRENIQPISSVQYKDVVSYLSQISSVSVSDIKDFLKTLEQQNRYARGIILLLQLQKVGNWVKDRILNYTVEIVSNNDSEKKNITSLKEVCKDQSVCKDAAINLAKLAQQKAQNKDYKTAVLFDKYAAEYLSDDNSFNFDRCTHTLEELSNRADSKEVKKLLDLAHSLKLNESQMTKLSNRINEIAVAVLPSKGLAICQLFIGDPNFNKVYLEKALAMAKAGERLDLKELRKVIGQQSNETALPNVLAPFVAYLPTFEDEFVLSAINAILSSKSTDLLDKYWKVKHDTRFIMDLTNKSFESWHEMAVHIERNSGVYLDATAFINAYCSTLKSNGELEFTLDRLESLLKAEVDVKEFYISLAIESARKYPVAEKAIDLINRALKHISDNRLVAEKKRIITNLISEKIFGRAEEEIKSLTGKDDEAPTLLAELYFNQAKASSYNIEKVDFLEKVLSVDEQYSLHDRFLIYLQESLAKLSEISKSYSKEGCKEEAYRIASRIKPYWAHWIPLYAWLRYHSGEENKTLSAAIKHDAETLAEICKVCPSAKDYESEDFLSLWSRYYDNILKRSQSQPQDKAVASLVKLRKLINAYSPENFIASKIDELSKLIVRQKWELAIDFELELSFSEAIILYDEIVKDSVQSYINRAELRSLICHVKADNVDGGVEERIVKALELRSYESLREDLAYRYAHYLLKHTRPADAERTLQTYLPEEKELLSLCENIFVKVAEQKLAEFNSLVNKLNEGKMSVAEATQFKSDLRTYKKEITSRLSDLGRPFSQIAPKVESYILGKMFEEECYIDLLKKLMQENPNYVEDNTDFHNIAIASLGIIESDNDDEQTVKRAIATCLTAIYSDRLFVQSLDYTSWDDKFTFTLDGSLGQTNYDNYDELPDNVNFDTPVDNVNVAIKDVQNSLLTRVEAAVRKYHPTLEKFCNEEKEALSKLIELRLDKSYILASPLMCRTLSSIRMSIGNALEYELTQDYGNREDVIALGVDYGFNGQDFDWYAEAKQMLWTCKSVLSSNPVTAIDRAFEVWRVEHIKKYTRLFSDLKSATGTSMNEDIRSKMNFKAFLNKYEVVCKTINDNTLSLTCSNYVNGEVVHLLNEDKMELREGVGYMVRIYNIAPSNFQAKQNLEGILCGLAVKAETEGRSLDKNALSKAMTDTGNVFQGSVEDAKVQAALSVIVDKVNSGKIKNNTALIEVYSIYQKSPNNERVCENLVTLCEMCVFEYVINDAYGAAGVKSTLNSLARNMSPTFKQKARKLGITFREMWNKIPYDTKNLMCGGIDFSSSLSAHGEALKLGLQYLKKFGSVSTSRDADDPFASLGIGRSSALSSLFKTDLPDLPL